MPKQVIRNYLESLGYLLVGTDADPPEPVVRVADQIAQEWKVPPDLAQLMRRWRRA